MAFEEIEVKILEVNRPEVEARIRQLGGKLTFDDEMIAWFLDDERGSIKSKGDVLRLRKEGEETVLTYKKHVSRGEAKIMEETETVVSHAEQTLDIFTSLGYQIIKITHKHRTQYDLGDVHVVFDNYKGDLADIPEFIEVEAPGMEKLESVVKQLGFSMKDCNNWSTRELVKHYL
ncbi:MAG: class IV adenylate cyclase [Bacteroidota bacterium]